MLVRTYHSIQAILILCIRGISLNTTTEGNLLYTTIILHINEKGNHELQVQALSIIVADLQNHINNLSSGGGGGGVDEIGVS